MIMLGQMSGVALVALVKSFLEMGTNLCRFLAEERCAVIVFMEIFQLKGQVS